MGPGFKAANALNVTHGNYKAQIGRDSAEEKRVWTLLTGIADWANALESREIWAKAKTKLKTKVNYVDFQAVKNRKWFSTAQLADEEVKRGVAVMLFS